MELLRFLLGDMELHEPKLKVFFLRILRKIHQLFLIIIHFLFKIANFGKKEPIPQINDLILLNSASTLAAEIRKKKLKSVTVVKAYISRIQEVNPFIEAVVQLRENEALAEAANVDKFIESSQKTEEELERDTPFLGVPFTSKEIINVSGMPVTNGCVHRKGLISNSDSDAVLSMKLAGAIPIGVTNMGELAMWPESVNKVYGRTCNPYDLCRTAGGSTGGEGAIISAAGSIIGLGNDIGGSIRIPGCFNGIFGHKPTVGAVSNDGCTSFVNPKLNCYLSLGPMCRYATDLLPMLKVLSRNNCQRLRLDEPVNLHNLKIYYVDNTSDINFVTRTHPDVKNAISKAVHHFENAYKIKAKKIDVKYFQNAVKMVTAKFQEKGGFKIESGLNSKGKESFNYLWEILLWFFCLSKHVFHILIVGLCDNLFKSVDHSFGLATYDDTLRMLQETLDENSVLLHPSWPEPAPHHNEILLKPFDFAPFTAIFNILKFPATQCPMGLSGDGLPIGIQVVANENNDRLTIAVAVELEKAFGGWVSPCPLPD